MAKIIKYKYRFVSCPWRSAFHLYASRLYFILSICAKLKVSILVLITRVDQAHFTIVNFLFICSNIPAAPAIRGYISKRIRSSRACVQYIDFLDRSQLLTQKLLKQSNRTTLLLGWRHRYNMSVCLHHDLVVRNEISIPQMSMDLIPFTYLFFFSLPSTKPLTALTMNNMVGIL